MTPRARRVAWAGAAVAALALLVGAGAWWVLYTEPGAKWGFERLGGFFPGRLDARDLRGPLKGPLIVHHFTYRNDRLAITADSVLIDWKLRDLVRRRLDIRRLYADNVRVVIGGPGDTPQARDSLRGPLPDLDLPVTLIVRDGVLNGLTIAKPGNDSGFVIDRVALDAESRRGDSLRVRRLLVRSRKLDVDFAGIAVPRGAYPLLLRGQWTFRPAGRPAVRGEGMLTGTLDTLQVVQHLSGPLTADVNLRLLHPLREISVLGNVEFTGFTPRDFSPAWPEGTFRGRVALAGAPQSFTADGWTSGTTRTLGPVAARFRATREAPVWRIRNAAITRPGTRGRLTVHGTVFDETRSPRFDLQTQWTDVGWPLRGKPWVESDRGSARIAGTMRDFSLRLQGKLAGRNLPPGQWRLDGRGGRGRLAIRTVIADILDGRITGAGVVTWSPRVTWNLSYDAKGINPGTVWPAYPGNIDMVGRSEGVATRSGPSGRILVSRLGGTVRNQPVSASGTLAARQGQYSLSQAIAQWGPNRAEASGALGRSWDLDWKLDAPQIGQALAQASGSVKGQGNVSGTLRHPHIVGSMTGDSLFYRNTHAGALRAEGDIDLRPGGTIQLSAAATQVDAAGRSADRVVVTGRGTRESHEFRASVAGPADSAVAVFAGGVGRDTWSGQVRSFDLVHPRSGNWSLASPARLAASMRHAEVSDFVWQSGTSRITLAADWTRSGPWRVDSRLDQVQLALLQPELPPRLRVTGAMQGHVTLRGTGDGRLFADVDVVPGPGEVLRRTATGQWIPTRFENARIRAIANGERIEATFGTDFVGAGSIRGTLGWPAYGSFGPQNPRPLNGTVVLHLSDLALFQGFTADAEILGGSLDADLAIAGTVQRPFLYGPLTLRNGSVDVPRFGLHLREMNVQGSGTQGGAIALSGTVRSGTGTLAITGTAAVARNARPVAKIAVKGTNIQAMNTRDIELVASPDLLLALDGNRLDVTGEVIVPQGEIDIGRGDERRLVKVSPDVVFTGADTVTSKPMELHSRVRIVLGDKVRVRGFGMDVMPKGTVVATDAPGLPTLGLGRLYIDEGNYRIYGQDLAVESGSLIFGGGPITNPAVRARASRKAPDGTVAGFLVSGTVMKPAVEVFSDPPMGQSEALSYIMFGKPIESGNISEGQIASTMAVLMGVPGTNLIAQDLASDTGIEPRVQVGSTIESTSLSLGAHLSPKLFVSYGMDVFQSASSLLLRYILNRMFTIEAETATQNRVDILYNVER